MKINKPKNSNYAAIVVEIKTLVQLEGCDFVQAAIIFGNQVIVSKDVKIGDIGLYFPLECQLSHEFVSNNNLYRHSELNIDQDKKGYFDDNRRIKCVKFRGHKSEGLYMPLSSLEFIVLKQSGEKFPKLSWIPFELGIVPGLELDELDGIEICKKYIVQPQKTHTSRNSPKIKKGSIKSKLVEGQFRFHDDTSMLYKNLHKITPESLISITYKLHGTSGISSYLLCKKHVSIRSKIGEFFHKIYTFVTTLGQIKFELLDTEYDYLYSSRKVIKNEEINPNSKHYYDEDIWLLAHNKLKDHLQKGMTFYYEIVGFLPNGGMIQKDYDYGCNEKQFEIYIYRITQTNVDGKVFEFSSKQVQDFCKKNGLNAVPQLFYGFAKDFSDERMTTENWQNKFLEEIKKRYNEHDCYMCKNVVPEEGVVIRVEKLDLEAYKQKSFLFYERETKQMDKGESDIESEN